MTNIPEPTEENLAMIEKILELPCFRLHPMFPIVPVFEVTFGCGVKTHAENLFFAKFPCRFVIESYKQMQEHAIKTMEKTIEHLEALERGETPQAFENRIVIETVVPDSEGH
jgi:hypothetical protein